ncbi:ROK family protein [Puniceicoccales bacterium CK1056]|uniref:ROK family protein n=1 Tax=Oceanipulchritudo coccoides TaxID=2706888 RepID=A0A6B2M2Z6_9BACT|nr:ROK family protein [Oceanipulchritudo coccoides]NDV63123.1 ROK family protein [Oceanipulchritudo coccoides]
MLSLGIDIGGSGIKGAIVDTDKGELVTERLRIPTPDHSEAKVIIPIIQQIIDDLQWNRGPLGIGFPGVIHRQVIHTATNLHDSLIGINLAEEFQKVVDGPVRVLNDADAAGFSEMQYGAGKPYADSGTVLLVTVGTGVGTVLFSDGVLVPNLELGHIEYRGKNAESQVSEQARKTQDLSWKKWGKRLNGYLQMLEFLLQPDCLILGGGGVKKQEKFVEYLDLKTPWTFAQSGNLAGIIGAAAAAAAAAGK